MSLRQPLLRGAAAVVGRLSRTPTLQRLLFNAIRLDRPEVHDALADNDVQFLSYCMARRTRSRSQILQDLWVCFELEEKRNGFFIEFGATNGLVNSNTHLLETELGWTGVLSEPNPFWHAELGRNRVARIDHRCVAGRSGETVTFVTTNDSDPELSAIASFAEGDHFADVRRQGKPLPVETVSLDDLLRHHEAPAVIDYLSIDTEGSELEILQNFSFDRSIRLLSVETNPATRQRLRHLLATRGFQRVFPQFSQWDDWYVATGLRDARRRPLAVPRA